MRTTDRSRRWASTMSGHRTDSVVRAHVDSSAALGRTVGGATRRQREEAADEWLAPGATRAHGAGDRAVEEEPDPRRTCFERDRDRILHGTAFRRLAGKTQVFVFPDDHQRTRLTHALEVAQVARSVARGCRLDEALTEAIALGHDCGHGPFGHASEDALSPFVEGGFDHATWGADVALTPLNLCRETLDGVRNHSWSRPAPMTPEGEVVSWADRIAYVCHDFEDAVLAGVVDASALPSVVAGRAGTTRRAQLHSFIGALVDTTLDRGEVTMDGRTAEALAAFRSFNYEHIYLRPDSRAQASQVEALLGALVGWYAEDPRRLEAEGRAVDGDVLHGAVTFVAGMTDAYAVARAVDVLGWRRDRLPRSATG